MEIIIQELVVNCETDFHPRPTDLGRDTEWFVKRKVLPLVEEILNDLNPEFSHITLSKASINLDLPGINNSLDSITAASLRSVLKQQILTNIVEKAEHISVAEGVWKRFIFIVKKGYSPWGFKYKDHTDFEQNLLFHLAALESNAPFVTEIKKNDY
jgi:contractile injection system tape measure protein